MTDPRPDPTTLHRVTLADVAARAGVSRTAVSMVVNGKNGRLHPQTLERIRQAIADLDYRTNTAARSLRLSRGWTVAVLVVDRNPEFMSAPFTANLIAGLCNRLSQHGQPVSLQGVMPDQIDTLAAGSVAGADGVCLLLSGQEAERARVLELMARVRKPVVLFQDAAPRGMEDLCCVQQQDHEGGAMIARHVLELGARDLVILRPDQTWHSVSERVAGMLSVLDHAAGVRVRLARCDETRPDAVADWLATLAPLPEALLCANDRLAKSAWMALGRAGRRIPRDIVLTGFAAATDATDIHPGMSTIRSVAYQLGTTGAEAMMTRLHQGRFDSDRISLPVTLAPAF